VDQNENTSLADVRETSEHEGCHVFVDWKEPEEHGGDVSGVRVAVCGERSLMLWIIDKSLDLFNPDITLFVYFQYGISD
jgi:hypothetical protein